MDKSKILCLCNEIEMLMGEISNTGYTMQDCDYEAIDKRLKAIVAEITAPPKTNGDRIRQMTDKELAKVHTSLMIDAIYSPTFFYSMLKEEQITSANLEWLRKKVDKDD